RSEVAAGCARVDWSASGEGGVPALADVGLLFAPASPSLTLSCDVDGECAHRLWVGLRLGGIVWGPRPKLCFGWGWIPASRMAPSLFAPAAPPPTLARCQMFGKYKETMRSSTTALPSRSVQVVWKYVTSMGPRRA